MANVYDGMTEAQKANERTYLNNLVSSGGGNAEWAKGQLSQLNSSKGTTSSAPQGTPISTMRGTGTTSTKTSSKSSTPYSTVLTNKMSSSVSNPSGGVYSSLTNNNLPKDLETAYNTAKSKTTVPDNSIESYLAQYGIQTGSTNTNPYVSYGDMSTERLEGNPYEQLVKEQQRAYEEQQRLIEEKNKLAVEQGANRLESQKSNINQAANDNARQAYVQYMQNKKALPQQLASQGINGGATETANLALGATYENNLADINQNRANRIQEIDNAIVDLRNTGDLTTVEEVLANNQNALNAYTNAFNNGVGYNQWANQYNANRADTAWEQNYQQQAYTDQLAQQQLENDWYERNYSDTQKQQETNNVLSLLENGLVDTAKASALLGIPESQISNFVDYISRTRNAELSNTLSLINNRNSGGGSNPTPKATSASTINTIYNKAASLMAETGELADGLVNGQGHKERFLNSGITKAINYIAAQNITDSEKENIIKSLGLEKYL